MMRFNFNERAAYRKERSRYPDAAPVRRYLNCIAPFDPKYSALFTLQKDADALRIGLNGLIDEYARAASTGRSEAWERAGKAIMELFAYNGASAYQPRP